MTDTSLLRLVAALADVSNRESATRALARRLGVDELLLFTRDLESEALAPAPGFPPPTRDGPAWRDLLARRDEPGLRHVTVHGDEVPALTRVDGDGATLMLLGGPPDPADVEAMLSLVPLLGALVRAEATAAALDAELEATRRHKAEFIAMLGHELRNPMAAITGALELIRASPDAPDVLARARRVLERQSQQLTHLVDDLLDVARVTRGKISLRRQPVDVNEVVRRAVEVSHGLVSARKHRLQARYAATLPVLADPTRLEQIVTNLLSNAAIHTEEGGRLEVSITRDGDEAVVRVQDSGVGIASEQLGAIFEPFVQVAPTIDRSHGGVGLGLTLVKELTALHGGRIEATSEVGKGSIFTLGLPALPADQALAPTSSAAVTAASERRVLVVDDNIDAAEMLVELLAMWGHTAVHAADGVQALALGPGLLPEIVLLDIGLPGLDGYEVARRMRDDAAFMGAQIIAMTGYGQAEDRKRTAEAGFVAHLVKPIDFEELRRVLGDAA